MTDEEIDGLWISHGSLYDFARAIEAATRKATIEECAKVCEDYGDRVLDDSGLTDTCAREIRALVQDRQERDRG